MIIGGMGNIKFSTVGIETWATEKGQLTRACYGLPFRVLFWAWLCHFMPKKSHSMPTVNAGVIFKA